MKERKSMGRPEMPATAAERLRVAYSIRRRIDMLSPHPPAPRGLWKFRTWADYEEWRKVQTNPRLR